MSVLILSLFVFSSSCSLAFLCSPCLSLYHFCILMAAELLLLSLLAFCVVSSLLLLLPNSLSSWSVFLVTDSSASYTLSKSVSVLLLFGLSFTLWSGSVPVLACRGEVLVSFACSLSFASISPLLIPFSIISISDESWSTLSSNTISDKSEWVDTDSDPDWEREWDTDWEWDSERDWNFGWDWDRGWERNPRFPEWVPDPVQLLALGTSKYSSSFSSFSLWSLLHCCSSVADSDDPVNWL